MKFLYITPIEMKLFEVPKIEQGFLKLPKIAWRCSTWPKFEWSYYHFARVDLFCWNLPKFLQFMTHF